MKTAILLALVATTLVACGGSTVDPATVDERMRISRDNAKLNARAYARTNHPDVERVVFDSDSTISTTCPYGDGWASGTIMLEDGSAIDLKCQTTGSGKGDSGCLTKGSFMAKEVYAEQEGSCDTTLTSMERLAE